MNPRFSFSLGLLAALILHPTHAPAQAANSRVSVEAKIEATMEHKTTTPPADAKNAAKEPKTEEKGLAISITGKAKSPETRTGHWVIYGRRQGKDEHGISVTESGEFPIEIPAGGAQKVETKKVTFTFTPEHASGTGRTAKRVEASGTKFAGYSIEVKDGEAVVGETSDPVGIAAEVKAAAAKSAAK